jgi:hypothetical protein
MSIKDTIANDITNIFTVEDNTPISKQAVYTPPGGVSQDPVTVLYTNTPLHGDEQQDYQVFEAETMALGKFSDVSGWVLRGKVSIESIEYELINNPYPQDSFWSILHLRLPHANETKI